MIFLVQLEPSTSRDRGYANTTLWWHNSEALPDVSYTLQNYNKLSTKTNRYKLSSKPKLKTDFSRGREERHG